MDKVAGISWAAIAEQGPFLAVPPRKYVRCSAGCQQGLIFAYRNARGVQVLSTFFVCAVCEGSGKVAA